MRQWHLDPTPGYDPLVGRFVTMAADTRRRTLRDLEDLSPQELDVAPDWGSNTIGTLLYHLAAIEFDWTLTDLQGRDEGDFPAGFKDWFPVDVRGEDERLTPVVEPIQRHLERLEWVRGHLLYTLRTMSDTDLDSTFNQGGPGQEVGGGFILHHLMQHEAEHRGQIGEIKAALRT